MRRFLPPFLLLFLLTQNLRAQNLRAQNPGEEFGIQQLLVRNALNTRENIYVHTDREVYAPADTLWFKAYVRDRVTLQESLLSASLYVQLVDHAGNIVDRSKYLITNSGARGQFTLDHKLKEGRYLLVAYSSWTQNFSPEVVFRKPFLVRREKGESMLLYLDLDRLRYHKGDSIRAVVRCLDPLNREVEGVVVNYTFEGGSGEKVKGEVLTGAIPDTLVLAVDKDLRQPATLAMNARHQRERLDTTFVLPVLRGIHLDFMPEGGHGLLGLPSRMAFKAQSLKGETLRVQGQLLDRQGRVLKDLHSEHEGMGSFEWIPAGPGDLKVRITDPPGFDTLFPLPEGKASGYALSGEVEGDHLHVQIRQRNLPSDSILLVLTVRDQLLYIRQLGIGDTLEHRVPLQDLPAGIAVLTLFDMHMRPRAEQLFFLDGGRESGLKLQAQRNSYLPRDRVYMEISPEEAGIGSWEGDYSLSVVDRPLCLDEGLEAGNIRSSFLLSPEIKGHIHRPRYYMNTGDSAVRRHLDLLLATQGWRDYTLLSDSNYFKGAALPINRDMVRGTLLKQKFGRLPAPAPGSVNVFYGGNNSIIEVDTSGRFQFYPEYELKYNSGVLISGSVGGSSNHVILELDRPEFLKDYPLYLRELSDSLKQGEINAVARHRLGDKYNMGLAYHEWIEEVVVYKAGKRPKEEDYEIRLEEFAHDPRKARPEYIESAIDILGIMYNMGLSFEYDPANDVVNYLMYPRGVITWIVDDSHYGTAFTQVNSFVPHSIESFTLVRGPQTMMFGPNMTQVVVSLRTKKFDPDDPRSFEKLSKYHIPSYAVAREFYKPLYDTEKKRKSTVPDMRKTLHWEPELKIGEDGTARVEFFNGDRYTSVTCILEGISDQGIPVYEEFTYEVGLSRD